MGRTMTSTRAGEIIGYAGAGTCALCLLFTPLFSPGIVLAAMIGTAGGLTALMLGARRIGLVVVVFSLIPLSGLILVGQLYKPASNGYLIFAPVIAAIVFAMCSHRLLHPGKSACRR